MAGALTISTLNNDTGVLATQNGMTGIAKAWVNFNGTGTVAIRSSFNVSSITDNGTGNYTVNFTSAMPNTNYAASIQNKLQDGATNFSDISVIGGYSTSGFTVNCGYYQDIGTNNFRDQLYVNVAIFSS